MIKGDQQDQVGRLVNSLTFHTPFAASKDELVLVSP